MEGRKPTEVPGRWPDIQGEADRSAGGEGGQGGQDVPGCLAGAQDGNKGKRGAQAESQYSDCCGWAQDSR